MEKVSSVFKNLFSLIAPEPIRNKQRDYLEYDVVETLNEANEIVILHVPKIYSLSYR
jgi:hypothetical protein